MSIFPRLSGAVFFNWKVNGKVGQKQHPGSDCGDILSILIFHWGKKVLLLPSIGQYYFSWFIWAINRAIGQYYCSWFICVKSKVSCYLFVISQNECLLCFSYFLVSQYCFPPFAAIPMLHFIFSHSTRSLPSLAWCFPGVAVLLHLPSTKAAPLTLQLWLRICCQSSVSVLASFPTVMEASPHRGESFQ